MFEAREDFNSITGKRLVLIVDDEAINREMLGVFLQDEYDILMAADGEEAIQRI